MAATKADFSVGEEVLVVKGDFIGQVAKVISETACYVTVKVAASGKCPAFEKRFEKTSVVRTKMAAKPAPAAGGASRPATRAQAESASASAARAPARLFTVDFTAPVVEHFTPANVRGKTSGNIHKAAFRAHGDKDLYLNLPSAAYNDVASERIHGDHMGLDCVVAATALNHAFHGKAREVVKLYRDQITQITKDAITQPELINVTHGTVNAGPKKTGIDNSLEAVMSGKSSKFCDIAVTLSDGFASSPAFGELLRSGFGGRYLTRAKTRVYAENTTNAIQEHAPRALRSLSGQIKLHTYKNEVYEDYERTTHALLERMGIVD